MDIGKPEKVTEEPRPIRAPVIPFTIPTRQPDLVPIRKGVPWTTIPNKYAPGRTFDDILQKSEIPSKCPKCGSKLEEAGMFNFTLICPRHGVTFRERSVV